MSGNFIFPIMNQHPKIKITHFRKSFNIPSDFIRSTCKVLNLEILKVENEPVIPLYNQILQKDNDTILLYAFIESKSTGKIENTKRKEFNSDEFNKCADETKLKRVEYILIDDAPSETRITKRPKEAIDITSSSDLDFRREDFVSMLAEVVSRSVASQSKSVLNTQEELHTAMDKNWLLTNEQLGTLLGMSKSTIGSKPDGWVRMGFKYTKVKEGSMTLWRVSQY
jgi:hypothetical protein